MTTQLPLPIYAEVDRLTAHNRRLSLAVTDELEMLSVLIEWKGLPEGVRECIEISQDLLRRALAAPTQRPAMGTCTQHKPVIDPTALVDPLADVKAFMARDRAKHKAGQAV